MEIIPIIIAVVMTLHALGKHLGVPTGGLEVHVQ